MAYASVISKVVKPKIKLKAKKKRGPTKKTKLKVKAKVGSRSENRSVKAGKPKIKLKEDRPNSPKKQIAVRKNTLPATPKKKRVGRVAAKQRRLENAKKSLPAVATPTKKASNPRAAAAEKRKRRMALAGGLAGGAVGVGILASAGDKKAKPAKGNKPAVAAKASKPTKASTAAKPKKAESFGAAFKRNRAAGKKTFMHNGKSYHTKTKEDVAKSRKAKPKAKKSILSKDRLGIGSKDKLNLRARPKKKPMSVADKRKKRTGTRRPR